MTRSTKQKSNQSIARYGILTGLALILWIFIEFIAGRFFGISELGAIYGLLSESILALSLLFFFSGKRTDTISPRSRFWISCKIILIAAVTVLAFMLFYVPFINPQLFGLYDGTSAPALTSQISAIIGMFLGVLLEGFVVTLLIQAYISLRGLKTRLSS